VIGAKSIGDGTDFTSGRKEFIAKMNEKAKELNPTQTYFVNETGLDEEYTSGGYGSARDMAMLMKYIIENNLNLVEITKYTGDTLSSMSHTHTIKNTNIDIPKTPGMLASKTGYTTLAGGNLVIAFDPSMGRPMVAVVLGSTETGRFSDMQKLISASLEYIQE
jgi:D-alanyl-D-alanine carboxypeptidase